MQWSHETSVNVTTDTCGRWFSAIFCFLFLFILHFLLSPSSYKPSDSLSGSDKSAGLQQKQLLSGYNGGNYLPITQDHIKPCAETLLVHPPGPPFVPCLPTSARWCLHRIHGQHLHLLQVEAPLHGCFGSTCWSPAMPCL